MAEAESSSLSLTSSGVEGARSPFIACWWMAASALRVRGGSTGAITSLASMLVWWMSKPRLLMPFFNRTTSDRRFASLRTTSGTSDNVRQTLRVSSASPGGLARALRALRAAQSAVHRRSSDARVLQLSGHVTGPCFARVRRFRRRIVLVRLFPDSFNNSSLAFTLTSLDPRSNLRAAAPNSTEQHRTAPNSTEQHRTAPLEI